MRVKVMTAKKLRAQQWLVTLSCGHEQKSHSIQPLGPFYVDRCWTCEAKQKSEGKATR